MMPWLRIVRRADAHPSWGSLRIEIGRLWLIRCAPDRPNSPGHPPIPGHPHKWMIVWHRNLPEWNRRSYEFLQCMSKSAREEYFAALFPRIDKDVPDKLIVNKPQDPDRDLAAAFPPIARLACDAERHLEDHVVEIAEGLPALTKIARDLDYRLPGSGKPLAHIVLTRQQAAELLAHPVTQESVS
jgi:hypothetical protein